MGACSVQLYAKYTALGAYSWVDISNYVLSISGFDILYNNFDFSLKESTTNITISDLAIGFIYEPFAINKCIRIKNDADIVFIGYIEKTLYDRYKASSYKITLKSIISKTKNKRLALGDSDISGLKNTDLFLITNTVYENGVALDEILDSQVTSSMAEDTALAVAFMSDIIGKPAESEPAGLYLPRFINASAYLDTTRGVGGGTTSDATVWQLLEACCRMKITGLSSNLSNLWYTGSSFYLQNIDAGKTVSYSDNSVVNYSEDTLYIVRSIDFSCGIYNNVLTPTFDKYYTGGGDMISQADYTTPSGIYINRVDLGTHNSLVVSEIFIRGAGVPIPLATLKSIINPEEIRLQRFASTMLIKRYTIPMTMTDIAYAVDAKNVCGIKAIFNKGYLFMEIETFEEA